MADEQDKVKVTVVFTEGEPEEFLMTRSEREKFLRSFVSYVSASPNSGQKAGAYETWDGDTPGMAAFSFNHIRYIR